jgi:hypothetical protein
MNPFLLFSLGLVACRPPVAPEELDDIMGYLFTHHPDNSTAALRAGTENLDTWLNDHQDETWEGFQVSALPQESVDLLDDRERDLSDLIGVAVGYDIPYTVEEVITVGLFADPIEFNQGDIVEYERTLVEGTEVCFAEKSCEALTYITEALGNYPLGLEVRSKTMNQYKWVETDLGDVAIQRTWLMEPAEANWESINLDQQYYVVASIPTDAGMRRVEAGWVVMALGNLPVPESVAMNLAIGSLTAFKDKVVAWKEAHPE